MKITIMSCDRTPNYLDATIKRLRGHELRVVYQSSKSGRFPMNMVKTKKPYEDVQRNAQYNYAQVLRLANSNLIIEDDVKPSKHFEYLVNVTDRLLYEKNLTRYVVSFYSCYMWDMDKGFKLVNYPIDQFYGTQAMYYDRETRLQLSTYILDNIGRAPYDMQIKSFCKETGIPLLASNFSIFQHMGKVSTGLGYHHTCSNFADDYKWN